MSRTWRDMQRAQPGPAPPAAFDPAVVARRSECEGKRRLRNPIRAEQIAAEMSAKQAHPVHGYRCPWCGWIHLGRIIGWRYETRGPNANEQYANPHCPE